MKFSKLAVRLMVDFGLIGLMLWAFACRMTGTTIHEAIGFLMFFLLIAHNIFNWHWYKNIGLIARGCWRQRLNLAVVIGLMAVCLVLLISSLPLSRILYFIRGDDDFFMLQLHTTSAYWFLVLMSIHFGLHWGMVGAALRKVLRLNGSGARVRPAISAMFALIMIIGGTIASFKLNIGSKLLMQTSFYFWDGSQAGLFGAYILIMGMYAAITYCTLIFIPNYYRRR